MPTKIQDPGLNILRWTCFIGIQNKRKQKCTSLPENCYSIPCDQGWAFKMTKGDTLLSGEKSCYKTIIKNIPNFTKNIKIYLFIARL